MFRLFLGAPTIEELDNEPASYHWRTLSSSSDAPVAPTTLAFTTTDLEEASRRISRVYENVIFQDTDDGEEAKTHHSNSPDEDESTMITWDASNYTSRLEPSDVDPASIEQSISTLFETPEDSLGAYSDASSIGRFPTFNFSLHTVEPLRALKCFQKSNKRRNFLLVVLEIDGPDIIRLKKGVDAGKEVPLLKLILGDEEGDICKLTAWRETANTWSGAGDRIGVKRGDVVFLESVTASTDSSSSITLTASPNLLSQLQICYRTMPYTDEDMRLRPDLRIGYSDPAVRRISSIVTWFEKLAGLQMQRRYIV